MVGLIFDRDFPFSRATVRVLGIERAVQALVQLDVGEIAMNPALLAAHERSVRLVQIDLADNGEAGGVTVLGRLRGFRPDRLVVVYFEPRGKRAVERVQFEEVTLACLRFEPSLGRLEEFFNEAARTGIPGGAVEEIHVEPATGRLERIGVVDLGVVQI